MLDPIPPMSNAAATNTQAPSTRTLRSPARRRFMREKPRAACRIAALALAAALASPERAITADATSASPRVDYTKVTPPDLVKATPKGQLKNPYNDREASIVAQGSKLFLSYSCNGCHGGGGGGGICPPLTNDVWVYGGDDDTLFRLVTLGSDGLQKAGYTRVGQENVVGPMPPFGALIPNSDELWKILTFVRSRYSADADPKSKYGTPPDLQ
jgi:mono/diheme cytochrome c family protein